MAKSEAINIRVTEDEKKQLAARTTAAHLFTISDYVRQILFVHDAGADVRAALVDAVASMQMERETIQKELSAARDEWREGVQMLKREQQAERNFIDDALMKQSKKIFDGAADRQQAEKNISDSWLFPCGVVIAFFAGVIFS